MSQPRTDAAFLEDILVSVRNAQKFIQGMTLDEFSADEKTIYAVIRAFEVIGEAAKRVSPPIKNQRPDLPWKVMAAMRDKLIHDYFGVDLEVLWRTARENLPPLEPMLVQLLAEIQG
ncbi:MAG TPA: DUF86 domain-containing protein [Thermoanaerobaculia bacterium]|jgi:uncharacterized protein with HEPN domain|nr:DUF86 domain-containing protein [Thermoanaerobaculia bacterium]